MENSLIKTLVNLRGNARACVYTEPLWGLSLNLCIPYASIYMLALGLNDGQVGLVATVYMLSQVVSAFFSGPIVDKMGRRKAIALSDLIAWSLPCIFWLKAEGFWFFFVAALLNGTMQISLTAFDCLTIEDVEKKQVTGIQSLIVVSGQLSVLFAPISAILFSRLTLVPAIRILYINAFIVMNIKIVLLYIFSRESKVGLVRIEECRGKSIFSLAAGYRGIIKIIGRSRGTIFAIIISTLAGIVAMINTTFWQVIVSKKLLVPDHLLPLAPILKSVIAIIFLFLIAPHLTRKGVLKFPLLLGFGCYLVGQILLINAPPEGPEKYIILCISLIFDSFGFGNLMMLSRSLVALHSNPIERARIMAIVNMIIMAIIAPFGWIGGLLSNISRNLPFVLNLCILFLGVCITLIYYRKNTGTADYTM